MECLGRGLCTENVPLMKRDMSGSIEIFQLVHSKPTLDMAERALTVAITITNKFGQKAKTDFRSLIVGMKLFLCRIQKTSHFL